MIEPLTERERDVLRFLPSRLTVREIADELYVSVNTLKFHLRVIYRKLGVNTRAEAAEVARTMTKRPQVGPSVRSLDPPPPGWGGLTRGPAIMASTTRGAARRKPHDMDRQASELAEPRSQRAWRMSSRPLGDEPGIRTGSVA